MDEISNQPPGDDDPTRAAMDRRIEDGGLTAFRADPRPARRKVRPLLVGYSGNSQIMAYAVIAGGIVALFVIAVLFRLLGLAPG